MTSDRAPNIKALGLIAGNRRLPFLLAQQARRMGVRKLVAAAFAGETDPALAQAVDEIVWLKVGQLVKLIAAFRTRGIAHCVMAGQIAPRRLFDLRPDWRAVKLLLRLKEKNAQSIFGALADELAKEGIQLLELTPWLQPLMPPAGFRAGPEPSAERQDDLALAFRIAKEMSRLEIGQTVVVKNGAVLAVEAFEGTDACLERGGKLAGAGGSATAVKVAKEKHDMRFDLPCLGATTLEICARAGISAVGFEASKTLLLEEKEMRAMAEQHRITLTALAPPRP